MADDVLFFLARATRVRRGVAGIQRLGIRQPVSLILFAAVRFV